MVPDYLQSLSAEERLLLSLCRLDFSEGQKEEITSLMKKVSDWDRFVHLANEHGIIALFWYNLSETGNRNRIPSCYFEMLHTGYLKSLTNNTFLYEQLNEIVFLAKEENIKIVLLKGIVLEKAIYGNQGLRQMSDIDLLVEMDKANTIRNILIKNGFNSIPLISPLHTKILPHLKSHLPVLEKKGILLEIHVKLFEQEDNSLTMQLFDTAYKSPDDNAGIFYPQTQLHFLYLIKHLDRHLKTKDLKLKLYCDLVILLSRFQSEILNKQLIELARKAKIESAITEILVLLEIFWGISFPEWIQGITSKADIRMIAKKFINFLSHPEDFPRETESGFTFKPLKEIRGAFNKVLFITGYLFPSKEYMQYKYNSKTIFLTMLYYPRRWAGLVKRILGLKKMVRGIKRQSLQ